MKRLLAILFTLIYFLGVVGVQMHLHYCMGEVENIAFYKEAKKCMCGDKTVHTEHESVSNNCCSNGFIDIQIDDDQHASNSISFSALKATIISFLQTNYIISEEKLVSENPNFSSSVPSNNEPIWLILNTFIFYG